MVDDNDDRDDGGNARENGSGKGAKSGQGYRKDGKPFKDGNTREDGSYAIGKNRTPEHSRFAVGDGRKRGRRPKGQKNDDTEFTKELNRKVSVKENGEERIVTKGQATDIRLIDNAMKGQIRSIEFVDERRRHIADKAEAAKRYHTLDATEVLRIYLRQRQDELNIDPNLFGDPEPDGNAEATDD